MRTERPTCRECACNKVCEYFENENSRNLDETCPLCYWEKYFVPKQEWISVEDRLPEIECDTRTWGELKIRNSVRVLCTCKQKSGKILVKEGYCEVWGDSNSQRVYWKIPGSIDKVTHWMPLPEPPKMKGGRE